MANTSKLTARWMQFQFSEILILACTFILMAGCNNAAPSSDTTPPNIYILKWERNPQGTQGPQTQIQPGGQFTVPLSWLGAGEATNKADIKVYAEDNEGVSKLEVSGTSKGFCSTDPNSSLQVFTSPGPIPVSFPMQTVNTAAGSVKPSMAVHLDGFLSKASCGTHHYNGMTNSQEFFLDAGTWTITAKAENCCGGQSTATFTIVVQ